MSPRSDAAGAPERLSSGLGRIREFGEPRLGIDVRALGAFRITLGLLILVDLLALRLPGLGTFYTDDGVFPRSALAEVYPAFETGSLHALSGAAWFQGVLLAVTAAFAVLLLVGHRTRIAAAGSLVLLASLHARNPYLANGGDTILLSFLVLGLFLPLGARWSFDADRRSDRSGQGDAAPRSERVVSLATVTILLHFVLVYVTNAILKLQSDAWMEGVAVQRIFHLEQYLTPIGSSLAEFSVLLTVGNWLWIALLASSILLPVLTGWPRITLVAGFVAAHLGMAATMRLGVFPFVMIAGLLLFLPSPIWDRLARIVATAELDRRIGAVRESTASDGGTPRRARSVAALGSLRLDTVRARRGVRVVSSVVVVCLLVTSVLWQAAAVGAGVPLIGSSDLDEDGDGDGDLGSWSFFAPNPPDAYSWYTAEATLDSGETVTALPGGDVRFDRPPDGTDAYPSPLWKRYGMDVRYAGDTHYEPAAEFSCEQFDRDVESVTITHVEQPVGPDGPEGEPDRQDRIGYVC